LFIELSLSLFCLGVSWAILYLLYTSSVPVIQHTSKFAHGIVYAAVTGHEIVLLPNKIHAVVI
jgi:hypothetical protein